MSLEMVYRGRLGTKATDSVLKWNCVVRESVSGGVNIDKIAMEDSAEPSSNPISQGCGQHSQISIQISPTTGGDFSLTVEPNITVENLKKLVSKKLKLPRDRICLLFRDKCVFIYAYLWDIYTYFKNRKETNRRWVILMMSLPFVFQTIARRYYHTTWCIRWFKSYFTT